jgi:hypothetical protein
MRPALRILRSSALLILVVGVFAPALTSLARLSWDAARLERV